MTKLLRLGSFGALVPILLVLILGLAPLVEVAMNFSPPFFSAPARERLFEGLVAGLLAVFAALTFTRTWKASIGTAFRGTCGLLVLLVFCWTLFCFFRSPYPAFAFAEWLRVVFCSCLFAAAAYGLDRHQSRQVVTGLVVLGTAMSMYGLLQYGAARSAGGANAFDHMLGLFGDNENLGSFLMLLLPLAIRQALDRENSEMLRVGSQGAALLLLIALTVSCTRSAWLGEAAALGVMGMLMSRDQGRRKASRAEQRHPRQWLIFVLPVTVLVAALLVGGSTTMVSRRALSLTHTTALFSFTDRLYKSEAAARMTLAHPLAGWGLGTWPVTQRRWTGEGDSLPQVFARHDLWSRGGDQQSLAHNFYAQWAAETGLMGLGLYTATFASFFVFALRRLLSIKSVRTRGVLISCVAAVTGGCLDALTSPAYNFPAVSGLLWLCLGLGTAASTEART